VAENGIPTTIRIGGEVFERIRYGSKQDDWGTDRQPCHDCCVAKGAFHIFGCDVERYLAVEAALYCDCPYDD